MKKLVTIVSAVMMLLMLAACAPTYEYSAEDLEQIAKGNAVLAAVYSVAMDKYAEEEKALEEGEEMPAIWTFTLSEDKKVDDATVLKGAYVKLTDSDIIIKGKVTAKFDGENEETVSAEYYATVTKDSFEYGPFTVNGKGYLPTLAQWN